MFHLVKGSCLDQKADVVVNAANPWLLAGRGVCGAIFEKAGMGKLQKACEKHADKDHPLYAGDAVLTDGFDVGFKAIIHAVGPDFRLPKSHLSDLVDAYYHAMMVGLDEGYKSFSFPLISCGIFSGNRFANIVALSTMAAMMAYENCLAYGDDPEVYLCAFTDKEYEDAKIGYDFMIETM